MDNNQDAVQDQKLDTAAANTPAMSTPAPSAQGITASECSTCSGGGPALAYALGQLDYDFGTEARRDSFLQHGISNSRDPEAMRDYLSKNSAHATAVTRTLVQEATPIYASHPAGPFAAEAYATLREFLSGQIHNGVERVSIPDVTGGSVTLLNGQKVPLIVHSTTPQVEVFLAGSSRATAGGKRGGDRYQGQKGWSPANASATCSDVKHQRGPGLARARTQLPPTGYAWSLLLRSDTSSVNVRTATSNTKNEWIVTPGPPETIDDYIEYEAGIGMVAYQSPSSVVETITNKMTSQDAS